MVPCGAEVLAARFSDSSVGSVTCEIGGAIGLNLRLPEGTVSRKHRFAMGFKKSD